MTRVLTTGMFGAESEAMIAFDEWVGRSEAFSIYRECWGDYLFQRVGVEIKRPRIDRILVPRQKAIDAGWQYGALGVEGKTSGHKIGEAISQIIDYSQAAFELRKDGALFASVVLRWIFLYPCELQVCDIGSVMAQQRIGWVTAGKRAMNFTCGQTNGLSIRDDGIVVAHPLPMGNKRGSR